RIQQDVHDFDQNIEDKRYAFSDEDINEVSELKRYMTCGHASFASQLSSLLMEVRSGRKEVVELENLVEQIQSDVSSPERITQLLRNFSSLRDKIAFAKTCVKAGASYIGRGSSLEAELRSRVASKSFVFAFNKQSKLDSDRWRANQRIFFQELEKKMG